MSEEAINFKKENKLNYKDMKLSELLNLPAYNGVIDFKISKTSFKILNIFNDDSSAVKFFWHGSHDIVSLDLWYEICRDQGIYIDVGAHTGLYTITATKSNSLNKLVSIEPLYINLARLLTNLRLNKIKNPVNPYLFAVSDFNGISKFINNEDPSYLSKGGRIGNEGFPIQTVKLDSLKLNRDEKIKGIKIDAEGEDYKILIGANNLIKLHKPNIIIEVRDKNKIEIYDFFNEHNYSVADVSDPNKKIDLNKLKITNVLNIFAEPKN